MKTVAVELPRPAWQADWHTVLGDECWSHSGKEIVECLLILRRLGISSIKDVGITIVIILKLFTRSYARFLLALMIVF